MQQVEDETAISDRLAAERAKRSRPRCGTCWYCATRRRARELDQQIEGFGEQRKTLAGRLPAELIALYGKIAQRAGGTGAAELRARRCGGCGLELDVSELKRQAARPFDQVLRCEECGRILVRTDNSGL